MVFFFFFFPCPLDADDDDNDDDDADSKRALLRAFFYLSYLFLHQSPNIDVINTGSICYQRRGRGLARSWMFFIVQRVECCFSVFSRRTTAARLSDSDGVDGNWRLCAIRVALPMRYSHQ